MNLVVFVYAYKCINSNNMHLHVADMYNMADTMNTITIGYTYQLKQQIASG